MKAILLLQARTNSSRLPGKVLLPVGGVPLVVLAARRAGNTGHRVLVVTSHESSDDVLCNVLGSWSVDYFRGELQNTLKRFVDAVEGVPDDHIVVRLTGDNVFPDGVFVDEMLEDFEKRGLVYLCCAGETSGLPYGVSAEVTRAGFLRAANQNTKSGFDLEHVTPWIIRNHGRNYFERYRDLGMSQYRCTVDTLDDYLLVSGIFGNAESPEQLPLDLLLDKLRTASKDLVTPIPASRMVLGTAQFGLHYGIANKTGRPEQALVNRIIRTAITNGVQYLDTARGYGDSEQVIGKALSGGWCSRVTTISKLSPLDDCSSEASPEIAKVYTERSVYQSCHALGVSKLDVLMLHRASHLTAWDGAVWDTLLHLKGGGVVGALGVSVQSPEEALTALGFEDVGFIQLPFNILDYRWGPVVEEISRVRQHRSVIVHARSALLQGLLVSAEENLWQRAWCSNPTQVLNWLRKQADQYTDGDVVELCLRYVLSQRWIDGVVIGVDAIEQLAQNLITVSSKYFSEEQLNLIVTERPSVTEQTLNPATWKNQ